MNSVGSTGGGGGGMTGGGGVGDEGGGGGMASLDGGCAELVDGSSPTRLQSAMHSRSYSESSKSISQSEPKSNARFRLPSEPASELGYLAAILGIGNILF